MSRWKAALLHLTVSALVGGTVLALVYFVLYTPQLFMGMGGGQLLLLLIAVDVVLGPLLTLIVFKSGKKLLWMDLSIIFALQLGALVYGLATVITARPVFIVVRPDFATVITAADLPPDILERAKYPEFKQLSWTGPAVVGARLPITAEEKSRIMDQTISTGRDIEALPEHYVRFSDMQSELRDRAVPLSDETGRKPEIQQVVNEWLLDNGLTAAQVRSIHLLTRKETYLLAFAADDGRYLGIIMVDPS